MLLQVSFRYDIVLFVKWTINFHYIQSSAFSKLYKTIKTKIEKKRFKRLTSFYLISLKCHKYEEDYLDFKKDF